MTSNNIVFAIAMLVVCVFVVSASAAVPLARSASNTQERVYDFTVSESKDLASWTAFGREWIVHLELSDVVEDNTDYFHGTLEGDASAVVSFALLPGLSLSGMVITGETTWWIRAMPVVENGMSEAEADLGIFMIQEQSSLQNTLSQFATPLEAGVELDVNPSSSCASGASLEVEVDASAALNDRKRTISTYKVGILFDQKWATASNNPWSSQADTLGLFNDVNAIYKAAGLGQFQAQYLKQVTNSLTTLNDMLNYISDTASANIAAMKDTSYTNYIWLVGTNVGGLAYVGTTCQGTRSAQNKKLLSLVWSITRVCSPLRRSLTNWVTIVVLYTNSITLAPRL